MTMNYKIFLEIFLQKIFMIGNTISINEIILSLLENHFEGPLEKTNLQKRSSKLAQSTAISTVVDVRFPP